MTASEQAANAIKWIEDLPSKKQAPLGERGYLGDKVHGFCCLGAGCSVLDIGFQAYATRSDALMEAAGLKTNTGDFSKKRYYSRGNLMGLNDETKAGFKRIATLMKNHPNWIFELDVAKLISEHYKSKLTQDARPQK